MTYNSNLLNRYVENNTDNWKKNQITFYFVEEGPGRRSEYIKKEYNINCFDFFFFTVFFFYGCHGWKSHNQLPTSALK